LRPPVNRRFHSPAPVFLAMYSSLRHGLAVKTAARVRQVSSRKELEKAFAIRIRVFVKEQGVPGEIEMDRDDGRAVHFLAFSGEKTVGTARVVMRGKSAKIGRMAVLKSYRRRGVGKKLLKCAVAMARRQGAQNIYLHAQVPVIGFYETMGFRCAGPVFDEAGILHRKMILSRPD
jgi:predicted GNAT family N-acyltransferase